MRLAGSELELADSGVVGALGLVSRSDLGAVEVHLSVDQVIVREDRSCSWRHRLLYQRQIRRVVPVSQHHRADVDVIALLVGTVNNQRTEDTARVLSTVE